MAEAAEKLVTAVEPIKAITAVITELPNVVAAIEELARMVLGAFDRAHERTESLSEEGVMNNAKLICARQDLKIVARVALSYVERMKDLFELGRNDERWSIITEQLLTEKRNWYWLWLRSSPTPITECLKKFVGDLKRTLEKVKQLIKELREAIGGAIVSTNNAVIECDYRANQSKREADRAARTGAVTTTMVAVGVGVAAGIAFGPPAGIGAGAAVCAAGAVVTVYVWQVYRQLEDAFREQHTTLQTLEGYGRDMEDNTIQLHCAMENLSMLVEDIEHCLQDSTTLTSVCDHLHLLHTKFEDMSSMLVECHSTLRTRLSTLVVDTSIVDSCSVVTHAE